MHTEYRVAALQEFRDQQVRFAPREKKLEQVAAAEKLLTEIEPDRTYTYEYFCYRITRFRPEAYRDVKFVGRDATHDLRLFVEDLSDAANVAAELGGRARDHDRGARQAVQRIHEDDFALAPLGPDQPPLRDGWPQAGRLPGKLGRSLRGAEFRQGPPWLAVQPA